MSPSTGAPGSERFAFGENWRRFLNELSEERIQRAERSLRDMLELDDLRGRSFLDVGSGSGLFSLAARRMGARVHSFDYDSESVACTAELRDRFRPQDPDWVVDRGSILDLDYLGGLGSFDIVYSWGVLHHTGDQWRAMANVHDRVAPEGLLYLALYNDQGTASRLWKGVKRTYVRSPAPIRAMLLTLALIRLWGPTMVRDALRLRPFETWRSYRQERGMSPWHDVVDWVGGYPFEVSRPDEVFDFFRSRAYTLSRLRTRAGGHGCNEFVFRRAS